MGAKSARSPQELAFLQDAHTSNTCDVACRSETPARGTWQTRIGRYSSRNQIYHVTTVTIERQPFFKRLRNGRCVVKAIQSEEDLADVARYIVANPLRAEIVRSIREYPLWDAKWLP